MPSSRYFKWTKTKTSCLKLQSFISGVGDTDSSVNKKLKHQSQIPSDFMFTKSQRYDLLQTIIQIEHFMQVQQSIDEFMTNGAKLYIIT